MTASLPPTEMLDPTEPATASASESGKAQSPALLSSASDDPLFYVGIGASAGGLEALQPFVANLVPGTNMTYIIAQHMSPHHRSLMVELLIRETSLKVEEARNGQAPKANIIYVAPPNSDITLVNKRICLTRPQGGVGPKPSVDRFFMSLAEDCEERAVGVILSGTGSDGAHGIKAIRAAGGVTIAQDAESAKYDSMPRAAVRLSGVDLVLPPAEIARQLASIATLPRVSIIEDADEEPPASLRDIIRLVTTHSGMDFSSYKDATLSRQVQRRMTALQIPSVLSYGEHLSGNREELSELASSFLICVTSFFRDKESFDVLRQQLRGVLARKNPGDEIRLWVPGCATGEEAYSLAILLSEELGSARDQYRIQIFATDLNNESIMVGRRGVYPEASFTEMPASLVEKYFTQRDGNYSVDSWLKDAVLFARQDLVQDPPFVRIDLISCRNLLIYFKQELQDRVLRVFHYALRPGGLLFLGKSESVGKYAHLFSETDRRHKIYGRRDAQTPQIGGFSRSRSGVLVASARKEPEVIRTPGELGHDKLFALYAPNSLLVTTEGEIIEFIGNCADFLTIPKGRADFNLFSIINPAFRAEVRAFMHRVARSQESAYGNPAVLSINGEKASFRLAVHYVAAQNTNDSAYLVVSFEPATRKSALDGHENSIDEATALRLAELDHEVKLTRENLQTVIEELETSNEELQALNEEAQASNEELQASNEELETANEELQASNEELTTVNDELSSKTTALAELNCDLENILGTLSNALLVIDANFNVTRYNDLVTKFFSIDAGHGSVNLTTLPIHFSMPDLILRIKKALATGKESEAEFEKDGLHYLLRLLPYRASGSRDLKGMILAIHDITDKLQAEEKLRLSASVFEHAIEATIITDADNRIISVNPSFTRITGYTPEEVAGRNPNMLSSGRHDPAFFKRLWYSLRTTGQWKGEVWNRRKNGEVYPEWLTINVLKDQDNRVIRHIAVFSDITDSKKAQEVIERQASYDTLTGLPNRNLMFDRINRQVPSAQRTGRPFALLFVDLDDFKDINDSLGHAVGDELLKEVSRRLTDAVREVDSVGRLGGDEFLILLAELEAASNVAAVANKILADLEHPLLIDGHPLQISASVGITLFPDDGDNTETLLRNADSAMYSAKRAGRNAYAFFAKSMQDDAEERHWIASALKLALRSDDQLSCHYQPIINLSDGSIHGVEALARWTHPERGIIAPDRFIPVAEQTGQMVRLGELLAEIILRDSAQWINWQQQRLTVSINVSALQVRNGAELRRLRQVFRGSPQLKFGAIQIEMTESLKLSDRPEYQTALSTLKADGYSIAIDDFGTGYSSLNYLKQFPFDTIKIDRSFVADITNDPDDAAMIEAILMMAQSLRYDVVAEGIETEAQLNFLKERGCTYGQGYWFSRPLPQADFQKFLEGRPLSPKKT